MDLSAKIEHSRHYGNEFLTWLLFRSTVGSGAVRTWEGGEIEVWFEDKARAVDPLKAKEQDTFKGEKPAHSREALEAIRRGKMLEEAGLSITEGEKEWHFSLNGPRWSLNTVKIPALLKEDGDDRVLERFYLLEQLHIKLESLYRTFLELRLDPGSWKKEKHNLGKWIRGVGASAEL
jgi:hypothetical protein